MFGMYYINFYKLHQDLPLSSPKQPLAIGPIKKITTDVYFTFYFSNRQCICFADMYLILCVLCAYVFRKNAIRGCVINLKIVPTIQ